MYLRDPATGVPRPFAEAKGIFLYRFSYPADFGGANFPVPWTTGKADFVIHSNFFTPSPIKWEGIGETPNSPLPWWEGVAGGG